MLVRLGEVDDQARRRVGPVVVVADDVEGETDPMRDTNSTPSTVRNCSMSNDADPISMSGPRRGVEVAVDRRRRSTGAR